MGDDIRRLDDTRRLAIEAAGWLGMAIEPTLVDGVAASLELLRQHAARVMAFELPADEEAAPVYVAGPPVP